MFLNPSTLNRFKISSIILKIRFLLFTLFVLPLSKELIHSSDNCIEPWTTLCILQPASLLTLKYMLHGLSGDDRCPFPLQSQNPKSNQVVEVLGKRPGSSSAREDDGQQLCKVY